MADLDGVIPGFVDEARGVKSPPRSPEPLGWVYGRAASSSSNSSFGQREKQDAASAGGGSLPLDIMRRQPSTSHEEEEICGSVSCPGPRKVWKETTTMVLTASGRKSGTDNSAVVSQITVLMQGLQKHIDKKMERAVNDITKSIETLHLARSGWQREDSRFSALSEDPRAGPECDHSGERYCSDRSGGCVPDSRELHLPAAVTSHIHDSDYSMDQIQWAQESHLIQLFKESRRRARANRFAAGSGSSVHATIGTAGDGKSSSAPNLNDIIEHETLEENFPSPRPLSMLLLRVWGIFPWSESSPRRRILSVMYQTLVLVMSICAIGHRIYDTVLHYAATEQSLERGVMGSLIVSISASIGLIQAQRLAKISELKGVLATEGTEKRFFWGLISNNDFGAFLNIVAFALIVITNMVDPFDPHRLENGFEFRVEVIFFSGVLCSVNFFVFVIAQAMQMTAAGFCPGFMRKPHFGEAIECWASIQAMLHKLCKDLAAALLTLAFTALAIVATFVFKTEDDKGKLEVLFAGLPFLILPLYIVTTFHQAAEVTEMCARVPPLINSLNFGVQLDLDRLHLVQYIAHSKAGFYFDKMRLTGSMVTKATYVMGLLTLSQLTGNSSL